MSWLAFLDIIEPKLVVVGTPIYSLLVKITGDNLGLMIEGL